MKHRCVSPTACAVMKRCGQTRFHEACSDAPGTVELPRRPFKLRGDSVVEFVWCDRCKANGVPIGGRDDPLVTREEPVLCPNCAPKGKEKPVLDCEMLNACQTLGKCQMETVWHMARCGNAPVGKGDQVPITDDKDKATVGEVAEEEDRLRGALLFALKKALEMEGKTQTWLSKELEVSQPYVSQLLNGRKKHVSLGQLVGIAFLLGYRFDLSMSKMEPKKKEEEEEGSEFNPSNGDFLGWGMF